MLQTRWCLWHAWIIFTVAALSALILPFDPQIDAYVICGALILTDSYLAFRIWRKRKRFTTGMLCLTLSASVGVFGLLMPLFGILVFATTSPFAASFVEFEYGEPMTLRFPGLTLFLALLAPEIALWALPTGELLSVGASAVLAAAANALYFWHAREGALTSASGN